MTDTPHKTGRNDPCPCGSGKKYKHCCLKSDETVSPDELQWQRVRRAIDGLTRDLMNFADAWYGRDALYEAWDEFMLWDETPFAPESPYIGLFIPWYLFNWTPDPYDETSVPEAARDEQPLGLAYLRHKGKHLDPLRARYVEQCCAARFSFHDILAVRPGQGLTLRDLFTGETVEVAERAASRSLQAGDIFYAKVVRIDDLALLDGSSVVAIPPIEKGEILDLRAHMREGYPDLNADTLKDWDGEIRDLYLDLAERVLNPLPPSLQNTDGEPLLFHRLAFDIASPRAAFDALKHLCLSASEADLRDEAEFDQDGEIRRVEFPWEKREPQHEGGGHTILGRILISGFDLTIEVNSEARAEAARALVEGLLHGQARYVTTVIESPQAMLADEEPSERADEMEDLNDTPEMQALIQQKLRDYYRNWPHEKIPALDNFTPLQAMQTEDGPERVEALLRHIERSGQKFGQPLDPEILRELREALGLQSPP